jgi:hypothetical protein
MKRSTWTARKPTPPINLGCACRAAAERSLKDGNSGRRCGRSTGDRRAALGTPLPVVSLDGVAGSDAGGILSTASGLVFTGDHDGYFYAFDAASGRRERWRFQTGAPHWGAAAITYMLDGRQWVLTPSGLTLTAFALPSRSGN